MTADVAELVSRSVDLQLRLHVHELPSFLLMHIYGLCDL